MIKCAGLCAIANAQFYALWWFTSKYFWGFQMHELRISVSSYLSDISSILNRVPRQLLLILKTNDLLRGIDHQLQTSKASRSFVTMSKCCAEAVAREELRTSGGWFGRIKAYSRWSVTNAQILLYQLSVHDYSLPSDICASVAANLITLLAISYLVDVSWPARTAWFRF